MSRNQLKRGRELVGLCNNRNSGFTGEEMASSTHSHFNIEPLPYEWPQNDPSLEVSEQNNLPSIENTRIEFAEKNIEVPSPELIQLSEHIGPYEKSSYTVDEGENLVEVISEKNHYGDIIIEPADDDYTKSKTIQVLNNIPELRIEYIDYQIEGNVNLIRDVVGIQNDSEANERCEMLMPADAENELPVAVEDNQSDQIEGNVNLIRDVVGIQNDSEANEKCEMLMPADAENELPVAVEDNQSEQMSRKEKKISRKRKLNKSEWKFEKMKNARATGKEYVTVKGKVIAEKTICHGTLCSNKCRLGCSSYFCEEERQRLLDEYYLLPINAKNAILFKSMKPVPVKRRLVAAQKVRRQTFTYHVKKSNNVEQTICKRAYMSLFQITVRKVQVIQEKHISGQILPKKDMRGKHDNRPKKVKAEVKEYAMTHIKSFPAEESHYSRNENPNKLYLSPLLNIREMHRLYIQKCESESMDSMYRVKECTYRNIFCSEFNLSFGLPRSDVCSRCENEDHEDDLQVHKETYKEAYELMKVDKNQCKREEGKLYCTVDIQQTMPLPKMPVGDAFYLRQIWFYNLGIHLVSKDKNHALMCTWTEDVAKKGSFEVSCALHYLAMYLKTTCENNAMKHLIIWSDSCSGQNNNFNLICQYQYMVLKKYFDVIEHKFPVVGHTYMDSDRDFGRIEKALRKHEKIYTPEEYRCIIKKNTSKNSVVVDMQEHLYDVEGVQKKMKLINRLKNTLGHKVDFRDEVKWIRVDHFGSYMYKKSYDPNTPFLMVDLLRKGATVSPDSVEIQRLAGCRDEISEEKKQDIRKQLKFIPMEKRFFYETILNA